MEDIKEIIQALEEKLLQPEVRKSAEELNHLLSDNFREFGSSGRVFNKQQILADLASETTARFVMGDFALTELSQGVVLATYKVIRSSENELETHSLRSSIWRKTGEVWQMVFHQGTKSSE